MNDEIEVLIRVPVTGYLEYTLYRPAGEAFKIASLEEIQEVLDCGDFILDKPDLLGVVVEET